MNPSPVIVTLDAPLEVARWRPLVHWLLAIPQMIVSTALAYALGARSFVAFFTILFTKKIPDGLFGFMVLCLRYQYRVNTYVLWMREPYPPWDFTPPPPTPGTIRLGCRSRSPASSTAGCR